MTSIDSKFKILPPFIEGLAKCFDIAGSFDDLSLPVPQDGSSLANDWQAVGLDYHNSVKIIREELNADQKIKTI